MSLSSYPFIPRLCGHKRSEGSGSPAPVDVVVENDFVVVENRIIKDVKEVGEEDVNRPVEDTLAVDGRFSLITLTTSGTTSPALRILHSSLFFYLLWE